MTSASSDSPSLLDGLAATRTIRRYADAPIPEDDLASILWHATRAPSGSNRQPVRYLVLRDGPKATEARRLLGETFRDGWAAKRAADGYDAGRGAEPGSPKARVAAAMQHYVDHFEKVPVVVLVCLVRHRAPNPGEGASVYPACQNLLLAARAMGYGGALTMWHGYVADQLHALFDIPDTVSLAACITLGVPAGRHGPVRRKPLNEVVFEEGWGVRTGWATDPDGTEHTAWTARHGDA